MLQAAAGSINQGELSISLADGEFFAIRREDDLASHRVNLDAQLTERVAADCPQLQELIVAQGSDGLFIRRQGD